MIKDNVNYNKINNISNKLYELNSEQINLHQLHEVQEKITQNYL